ncbi:uncharacterized protein G2W53_031219 [Senna tora]|uniref:Gag1-like clamp domain-containing protein n=1 Tax=Senna tora TaxID=362788 RepID=A0A834WBJ9_9FABA|nr:uncharacterized protein G2W53_031219 [Senna tora]
MEKLKLKCKEIFNKRGCLGCCTKPPSIISMDDPSRRLRSQARTTTKDEESEEFWNSSSLGIDQDHTHCVVVWKQTRQEWIRNRKCESETKVGEGRISYNATYKSLLGTNKPFPQPIPLREMVEFVVDIWEQDGLYEYE